MGGEYILEFVGLRAKMYSILKVDGCSKATAKGVMKAVKKKEITHKNYKECLFEKRQMKHSGWKIMQEKHKLFTAEVNKVSLSPFNDKKWISREGDKFESISFGHYKLK